MNDDNLKTIAQVREFLTGTRDINFILDSKIQRYDLIRRTLIRFEYYKLAKPDKGAVLNYLTHLTGYSRIQIKRLVTQWLTPIFACWLSLMSCMKVSQAPLPRSSVSALIPSLAKRNTLATISVSHLYNLRHSKTYQRQRCTLTKTRPKKAPIGQRRKPRPNDEPGYIRIDSVHQGDQDKRKGVYHINAIDEVTQFQVIVTLERIGEEFMLPALKDLLAVFPFKIRGFHADNGSEYINYTVAELLEKLHIEFTQSRPRHSNDNGLVESKNGSVIRKLYGYMHIP
ncbi:MAG: hypothetical protein V3T17_17770 [Pseudomonadales bacterium]